MDHSHSHSHSQTTKNIKTAFFLNLGFTIFEIFGGLYTNSMAILSDALHDIGDSFSLGLSWFLDKFSQKGKTEKYSYGYRRFSLLAAFINTVVLFVGSFFILSKAIPRLIHPEQPDAQGMVVFAIIGVLVNGIAVLRLRGGKSYNTRVVALHLLEDVLGWLAVLIVAIILLFRDIPVLDPILSILVTLYVLFNVFKNLKKTFALFLQAVPEDIDIEKLEQKIMNLTGVKSAHHTHIWSLDGVHHVLTTHVVVDKSARREQVVQLKKNIRNLATPIDFEHTAIEIEFENEECILKENEY
jgi:cobalt-zinc-cadmium efflux system protein